MRHLLRMLLLLKLRRKSANFLSISETNSQVSNSFQMPAQLLLKRSQPTSFLVRPHLKQLHQRQQLLQHLPLVLLAPTSVGNTTGVSTTALLAPASSETTVCETASEVIRCGRSSRSLLQRMLFRVVPKRLL